MKIEITELRQEISYYTIPDGTYKAKHSGYELKIETPMGIFIGKCNHGVRGMNIPCIVTVKDGKYELESCGTGKI